MTSLALGLVVYREPEWLVKTALLNAHSAYGRFLEKTIIIHKEPVPYKYDEFENVCVFNYPNNRKPQYLNMQFLYQKFLEESEAEFFITIDADTIVLRWDGQFKQLAGRFISYSKKALTKYWEDLNPLYQKLFMNFYHKGSIHSLQGGWSMRSRSIVAMMKELFIPDPELWRRNPYPLISNTIHRRPLEYHKIEDLMEQNFYQLETLPRERCGHELIFGHYLERLFHLGALPKVKQLLDPNDEQLYLTLEGVNVTNQQLAKAHAIHPIKTKEDLDNLSNRVELLRFE